MGSIYVNKGQRYHEMDEVYWHGVRCWLGGRLVFGWLFGKVRFKIFCVGGWCGALLFLLACLCFCCLASDLGTSARVFARVLSGLGGAYCKDRGDAGDQP